MKRQKKSRVAAGTLLFLAGIACFLYPNLREWRTQKEVEEIIEDFQQNYRIQSADKENRAYLNETGDSGYPGSQEPVTVSMSELSELYARMQSYNQWLKTDGQNITDAWSYEQTPVDLAPLFEEGEAIGYIEIPDMEVRLPLLLGASGENMAKGAAVLAGTSLPIGGENTNCVIAGHRGYRGSAYFRDIDKMKIGSIVYITNPWGTLVYRASEIRIVYPDDADSVMLREGKDMLTLLTCHPYASGGPQRYLVYCERAESLPAEAEPNSDREETASKAPGQELETERKVSEQPQIQTEAIAVDSLVNMERESRLALPLFTLMLTGFLFLIRWIRQKRIP